MLKKNSTNKIIHTSKRRDESEFINKEKQQKREKRFKLDA